MVHITSSLFFINSRGYLCWNLTQQPKSDLDSLIVEVRMSHMIRHTHTHTQSVGLLWKSDPSDAETSTLQYITLTRNGHPSPRRDSNSKFQKRVASDLRLRPHGRRDGHTHTHTRTHICINISFTLFFFGGKWGILFALELDCRMHRFAFWKVRVLHEFFLNTDIRNGR